MFERNEYPRPSFARQEWVNLNGEWDFSFDDDNIGETKQWFNQTNFDRKIQVPFSYESKASGIGEEAFHPNVWYTRTFHLSRQQREKRVILRFQASDYVTKVWVNGQFAGEHQGGSTAFSFDITPLIRKKGEHRVTVKAEDSQSCAQPRGKQRWVDHNFGCWYVQTTGIWQTVWLEFLPEVSLNHVHIRPNVDKRAVSMSYQLDGPVTEDVRVETEITFDGNLVRKQAMYPNRNSFELEMDVTGSFHHAQVMHWSPGHPHLYDVTFRVYQGEQLLDEVESYFGMRKISIENGQVLLNNHAIYQKLLLDQGYWPDTLLTPPSDQAILEDIEKTMEMGYNGVRKHQKLEDERFLYWADKKGLLVWSEMPSTYAYNTEAVEAFTDEWIRVVKQYYNHPSIITWVPFNESWGVHEIFSNKQQQQFTEAIYHMTKAIDPDRPVIVNDGWEHTISDIITLHDYEEFADKFKQRYAGKDEILTNQRPHNNARFAFAQGYGYQGQPIHISEYGGIAFKNESGWGYGNQVTSEEQFLQRMQALTDEIKRLPYVCGYCYTQITDVQQEVNGLLQEDRKPKIDIDKIRKVNESIF